MNDRHEPPFEASDILPDDCWAYSLFAIARLLDERGCLDALRDRRPEPAEIGGNQADSETGEPIRFRGWKSLKFPRGAVMHLDRELIPGRGGSSWRFVVDVASFGFIGQAGVLPRNYTGLLIERRRDGKALDTKALGECLDVFAHRLISLAVRTFGKYRPALLRARRLFRGESTGGFDPCEHVLASLVGFDQGQAERHLAKERQQLVSLAGPMSRRVPTAVGLRWILATVTGLPLDQVAIEQFVGRWLALSPEDLSRLGGQGRDTGNKLGESVTLGARVWSVDNAACVRFGPLQWGEYIKWLPQAAADLPSRIGRIVRFHVGAVDEISIRPILRGADVKRVQLRGASSGSNAGGQQLGWTTWLVSHDGCESDRDDLAYAIGPGGSPVRRRA